MIQFPKGLKITTTVITEGNFLEIMSVVNILLTLYGLFLLSGAYFGMKAGSKISLIMGAASGILVLLSVFLTRTNAHLGYVFLTLLSGSLSVTFLIRLIKTAKFMPSGMLLTISIIAFIISCIQLIRK